MGETTRVEELRRRVLADPASIAFAALAEEYRRLGQFEHAVETARAGLVRHPSYHSARVTLARCLFELGEHDQAGEQFEHVLKAAPQNLLARKGMADVLRQRGDLSGALEHLRFAAILAPQDPELNQAVWSVERGLGLSLPVGPPSPSHSRTAAGRPPLPLRAVVLPTPAESRPGTTEPPPLVGRDPGPALRGVSAFEVLPAVDVAASDPIPGPAAGDDATVSRSPAVEIAVERQLEALQDLLAHIERTRLARHQIQP